MAKVGNVGNQSGTSGTHNHGETSSESRSEGSRVARRPNSEKDSAWDVRGEEQREGRGEKVKKDKIEGANQCVCAAKQLDLDLWLNRQYSAIQLSKLQS